MMTTIEMNPAELNFCPVLTELVQSRRAVGQQGKTFEGLGSLSSVNNLVTLRKLMMEFQSRRTLEIGLSFGGSALVFAASHHDLQRPAARQHVALDPFQKTVWDSCGLMALEHAGLTGYVEFRPAYSAMELPRLIESGASFDLVYVDGSHLFEDVFVDAYFVLRLLSPGGLVAFDDSANRHVAKVLRFLRTNLRGLVEEVDLGRYRPVGGNGIAYALAKRLHKVQLTAFRRVGPAERKWDADFTRF